MEMYNAPSAAVSITSADVAAWRNYLGRTEVRRQTVDVETLRRFAAAVGAPLDVENRLPPLAHWAHFLEVAPAGALGPDGHPRRGDGIVPPVTLPHRMFAAASMQFFEPLTFGREAELILCVADVQYRKGKQGDLIFVHTDRTLTQDGRKRVVERQSFVYCGRGGANAVMPADLPAVVDEERWIPDTVELFRFSAVTFNSHRIHYDFPYTRDQEGYPALVVHGPLTAIKLFAFAQARSPAPLTHFSFRAKAPLFVHQPVRLVRADSADEFNATRCDGIVAMSASTSALQHL